jgi:aspartyl aminopeptidase
MASRARPSSYTLQLAVSFDHEEVGSGSSEGAHGTFLLDVLSRIYSLYGLGDEQKAIMKIQI